MEINNKKVKILYGKELAEDVLLSLRGKIVKAVKEGGEKPGLAIIMIGRDAASELYVRNKKKACHKVGIGFNDYRFEEDDSDEEILKTIEFLNNDPAIYGIIVQLPLPQKFNTEKIISAISAGKDADGFQPNNIRKFKAKEAGIYSDAVISPPVIKAVLALLDQIDDAMAGKKVAIISKNEIFAVPLREMLAFRKIDSEIVLPDAINKDSLKKFDILITAIGDPEFLKEDMIKKGAMIIDVGITLTDGKLKGDVDFAGCEKKASYISPVPGGIGPLTVAYLLENVVNAWEKKNRV